MTADSAVPRRTQAHHQAALETGRLVFHPLTNGQCVLDLESLADIQDALYGFRATPHLLCDLFVAKAKHAEILNGDNARLGMFNQLFGLAMTLEAIAVRLPQLPEAVDPEQAEAAERKERIDRGIAESLAINAMKAAIAAHEARLGGAA